MGFSEECDSLNASINNNTICDLSSIYNYHKSYIALCLKYPDSINTTHEIIRTKEFYFTCQNDFYKSKFIYEHINKTNNKIILDIYIINNQYYISEQCLLKLLADPKISNYLCVVNKINSYFPEIYIHQHNFNDIEYKIYNSEKYYYICNKQRYEQMKMFLEINYINYETNDQKILNLTNSFVDIVNDLQDQINSLKLQVENLKNNSFHNLGKHLYNN